MIELHKLLLGPVLETLQGSSPGLQPHADGQIRFGPGPTCKVPGASLPSTAKRCEGQHISRLFVKLASYCTQLASQHMSDTSPLYEAEQRNARGGCSKRGRHDANSAGIHVSRSTAQGSRQLYAAEASPTRERLLRVMTFSR